MEITHTALATKEILDRIRSINSDFATAMVDLITFFSTSYEKVFGFKAPPLHDPCAVLLVSNFLVKISKVCHFTPHEIFDVSLIEYKLFLEE